MAIKAVNEALQDRNIAVSVITELEVMRYHQLQKNHEKVLKGMFSELVVIELNTAFKQLTIDVGKPD